MEAIKPNGCGAVEAKQHVFLNPGGGTATHLAGFTVYRLPMTGYSAANPPNTPLAEVLFDHAAPDRDAHGPVARDERYVWMFDRAGNLAEVFDGATGARVNTVDLLSNGSADPTPDLAVIGPSGKATNSCSSPRATPGDRFSDRLPGHFWFLLTCFR